MEVNEASAREMVGDINPLAAYGILMIVIFGIPFFVSHFKGSQAFRKSGSSVSEDGSSSDKYEDIWQQKPNKLKLQQFGGIALIGSIVIYAMLWLYLQNYQRSSMDDPAEMWKHLTDGSIPNIFGKYLYFQNMAIALEAVGLILIIISFLIDDAQFNIDRSSLSASSSGSVLGQPNIQPDPPTMKNELPIAARPTGAMSNDVRANMLFEANRKTVIVAYLLWFFLGLLGGHNFYLKRTWIAIAQLILSIAGLITVVSLIISAIWVLVDAFLIPGWVRVQNNRLVAQLGV